jgi:hypothetical protein
MRSWLYNRIKAISLVADKVGDRVISSGSADNPETPFIVITMGVEDRPLEMPSTSKTQRIPFTASIHDTPGSMLPVDDLAIALKDGVPVSASLMIGNMSLISLEWTSTGQDGYDDHWGTNFRPVRFLAVTSR